MSKILNSKLEGNSKKLIGIFILSMFVIYFLSSLGKASWILWISFFAGLFLSLFLFSESLFIQWLRKKEYKQIGFGDAIVFLSVIASVGLLLNSLLMLNFIRQSSPLWLVNFTTTIAIVLSVMGVILAIIHFFSPKFK